MAVNIDTTNDKDSANNVNDINSIKIRAAGFAAQPYSLNIV